MILYGCMPIDDGTETLRFLVYFVSVFSYGNHQELGLKYTCSYRKFTQLSHATIRIYVFVIVLAQGSIYYAYTKVTLTPRLREFFFFRALCQRSFVLLLLWSSNKIYMFLSEIYSAFTCNNRNLAICHRLRAMLDLLELHNKILAFG